MMRLAMAAVLTIGFGTAARAESIRITSGSLIYTQGAASPFSLLSIEGERGFSLNVRPGNGIFEPGNCDFPECFPGGPLSLEARWVDLDLGGTATLDGRTFDGLGSSTSTSFAGVQFLGFVTLPSIGAAGGAAAPFTFAGEFGFSDGAGGLQRVSLVGSGRAYATLAPNASGDGATWSVTRLEYQFGDTAAVPEPATMVLVGGGLVAAAIRRRRRG